MSQAVWNGRFDPQAPLLVIGAGRSGSSLLARILDAHPDICFHHETDFLIAKLWHVVWENRRSSSFLPKALEAENAYKSYLAPLVAQAFVSFLGIDSEHSHWGYKEVWNGSSSHRYSWETYDLLFPRATWLHLVRHPLEFAASCAAWNRDELTDSYLEARLADWTAIVEHSRLRKSRERFHEVRYEDVIVQPRACLSPVLAELGLDWSEQCETPLKHILMASQRQRDKEQAVLRRFRRSKLLAQTAASLGYDL